MIDLRPRPGAWNMAFDEALLDAAAQRGEILLRIYRWAEPTLSLGHFQKTPPADLPDSLAVLPRVRRLSGGGAILHHHEWTYGLTVPKSHPLAVRPETLYEAVHGWLIAALALCGVESRMRGLTAVGTDADFLCFRRGDPRDVVVAGRKVIGSAQRRRRGAVLQHGSVLLTRSAFAPDLLGLRDLVPNLPDDPLLGVREFAAVAAVALFPDGVTTAVAADDVNYADRTAADYELGILR